MIKRSNSIKRFLELSTHADLADIYNEEMEVQVLVAEDGGERVDKEYRGKTWQSFTDGIQTWQTFRIPRNAWANPEDNDCEMTYDLSKHALGIGMTGWNWKQKRSIWVAYDFDALIGHSDKHKKKLDEQELNRIKEVVSNIPWVTLRKSTGGKGLHLYIYLGSIVETQNHTEHAALGRSILEQLSVIANFDFESKVDTCGGNIWIWHRKLNKEAGGLSLLKKGIEFTDIPANWKEHLDVVSGRSKKIVPFFIKEAKNPDEMEQLFNELSGQSRRIPLDNEHQQLLTWLSENGSGSWWSQDHHMLVTHTTLLEKAHKELGMKGFFKTIATGKDPGDHNCLSGNTEVITKRGVKTLKELAEIGHAELYVWNGEKFIWKDCEIKSFGIQKTVPITFGDDSVVRATKNHRWPYINEYDNYKAYIDGGNYKYTTMLQPRYTRIPIANQTLGKYDEKGYAHGFVFGDGWNENCRGKITSTVAFFKRDNDLLRLVSQYGNYGSQYFKGHGYINMVRQLPMEWKELPENPTKEYALGFILGLISADGFVDKKLLIVNKDYHVLDEIRKLAIYAGFHALPVRRRYQYSGYPTSNKYYYTLTLLSYNINKSYFLRKDHKEKLRIRTKHKAITIKEIDYKDEKEEEVYCAIVPEYENFVLANHVITLNCFAYPHRNGAWSVRRYTLGVQEHASWMQDGKGWTRCFLNLIPDLNTACRAYGGTERPAGGYVFREWEVANLALTMMGVCLKELPGFIRSRATTIRKHKDGRLVIEIQKEDRDPPSEELGNWLPEGSYWKRVINYTPDNGVADVPNFDQAVRHIVTEVGENAGWTIRTTEGWHHEPLEHVTRVLKGVYSYKPKEVDTITGNSIQAPWVLVNRPFEPEYPRDRQWNRNAVQLKYIPAQDIESLCFPTWSRILTHLGKDLDYAIKKSEWAIANGIKNGSDYLKIWLASLFQRPMEQLPYLFFYSEEENTGKSTFHEALSELVTGGIVRVDQALLPNSSFNGELENAIVGVIEETDLNKNRSGASVTLNRIKDWVTARNISIHKKGMTPIMLSNTCHFMQMANNRNACPVFSGDTRITVIKVNPLEELIPKKQLMEMLKKEAPDFLAELLNIDIPPSNDRLNIPVILTETKEQVQESNMDVLELFLKQYTYYVPGKAIKWSDLYDKFIQQLEPQYIEVWTKVYTGRHLPACYPKGRWTKDNAQLYVGNISYEPAPQTTPSLARLVVKNEFLTPDFETPVTNEVNLASENIP